MYTWLTKSSYAFQVGQLLEHTVGHVDPLHLVNMVPPGMSIPRSVLSLTKHSASPSASIRKRIQKISFKPYLPLMFLI